MGASFHRQDPSLQPQVLAASEAVHDSPTSLGGELLGFDFTVEYKPGASNVVADALSRRDTDLGLEEGAVLAVSAPRFDFVDRLHQAQAADPALVALRDEVTSGTRGAPWAVVDGVLQFGGAPLCSTGFFDAPRDFGGCPR